MQYEYRCVHIYADKDNNLIVIPTSRNEMYGGAIMEIDLPKKLDYPYSDEVLEKELKIVMESCYTLEAPDIKSGSPILKLLNIKSYDKAIKGKKLFNFEWDVDDGYYLTPTAKSKGKGHDYLYEKVIKLGKTYSDGDLAKAVRDVLQVCIV